jgi:hypothetical protein
MGHIRQLAGLLTDAALFDEPHAALVREACVPHR